MSDDNKKSFLRSLSPNSVTALVLCLVIIVNTLVHYTSPAYNKYEELGKSLTEQINKKFLLLDMAHSNFCERVQLEFVPQINNLITEMQSPKSVVSSPTSVLDSPESVPFLDVRASYNYTYCRVGSDLQRGAYINGWFYREGETYLGKRIVSLCPECAILDGGMIRPREDDTQINPNNYAQR